MTSLADWTLPRLDGTPQALDEYDGKLVLIVNTASRCGLTPQYEGLEALWRRYRDRGLVVLGFPCNQFMEQEPGTAEEIADFCSTTYDVTFPMFGKVDVNGPGTHPLYAWLKDQRPGDIEWNFAKFLVGRDGQVLERWSPQTTPAELESAIEQRI
jgi:glutathione peroxidase